MCQARPRRRTPGTLSVFLPALPSRTKNRAMLMSAHYHTMSSFSIIKELESYGPDLTLTLFTIKPVAAYA